MTSPRLFDPGLQPERTALAWRRTVLAIAVGAAVALRVLPPTLGPWSLTLGIAGLASAAVMWTLAGRRARRVSTSLRLGTHPLPDAALLLQLALTTSAGAGAGLLLIALR
ncbi:DUF202 domain-containing protein [Cellulomonas sp. NS3]|uniref:DUF202 domain-containing protein n=1 Tax=Cellulomonas sp. NS3 TaxID=2973977 RepID=UPI002161E64D|nr:DUF202 domain-containing protein [Cellulomonas sp. NS3]